MKNILKFLSSPVLMAALLIVLIVAMASATFIENDFGAEAARARVYNTFWFEAVFLLLAINLVYRMFSLKLFRIRKLPVFLFHLAFVVMMVGAAVTRYTGFEGTLHIREGQSSSVLQTEETALRVSVENNDGILTLEEYPFNVAHHRAFREKVKAGDRQISVELTRFYPNAYKKAVPDLQGAKVIGYIVVGSESRGFDYLCEGETKQYGGMTVSFQGDSTAGLRFLAEGDSLFILSNGPVTVKSMGDEAGSLVTAGKIAFVPMNVYEADGIRLVFQEYHPFATIQAMPASGENPGQGSAAIVFQISDGFNSSPLVLWQEEWGNRDQFAGLDNLKIGIGYGAKTVELPFSLHLDDFRIDRYPGSMSPSSFSSFVRVLEPGSEPVPYHIFMNNILKYKGYRFFQSSYDPDEQGTILSVNYDVWGTGITYFGYILLAVGIILSLLNPDSFFRKTRITEKAAIVILALFLSGRGGAQTVELSPVEAYGPVSEQHAREFGKLMVQNNKGRTEPVFTYASELVRKISRKEKINGLSPVRLFLEMNLQPGYWSHQPIIRISNRELQGQMGLPGKYASYSDFFTSGSYRLQGKVQEVYAKPPALRSKFDKAVLKTDEKVNICYGIFSGRYLKALPVPGNTANTNWYPSSEAKLYASTPGDSLFLAQVIPNYFREVEKARSTGDYSLAGELLVGLIDFQREHAGYELPHSFRIGVEMAYYTYNPFKKLFPFYFTLGIISLFYLFFVIAAGKKNSVTVQRLFFILALAGLIVHTLGLAARWYISGHAPMSNGYESMIFISWVTLLAGFIFRRRSGFALAATLVLAGLTLMVANLSFMDPEITNLVPVLQSYWLTIHVSVITASYGFLGLGALLGFIVLLLILLRTAKNQQRVADTLMNLTVLNHKTLILGLYLLTLGTFLGAVWANESWGRYWGWDPKETWALISILVYTLVTHARMISGMKGIFAFNVLSVYGFASILMTYFGVNYYLSGLHSYAGGDPVPVPSFVYFAVSGVIALTIGASVKFSKHFRNLNCETKQD